MNTAIVKQARHAPFDGAHADRPDDQSGRPLAAKQRCASNDVPQNVLVLKDLSSTPSTDCSDESRGMMQLIHDVAPASPLAFCRRAASKRFIGPQQLRPDVMYIALRLSAARQDIRQRAGRVTGPIPIPRSN